MNGCIKHNSQKEDRFCQKQKMIIISSLSPGLAQDNNWKALYKYW